MKMVLHIPFVSLPNLIAGKRVIAEMLVHLCTADSVDAELKAIMPGTPGQRRMLEGYDLIRSKLGTHGAAEKAAAAIVTDLDKS